MTWLRHACRLLAKKIQPTFKPTVVRTLIPLVSAISPHASAFLSLWGIAGVRTGHGELRHRVHRRESAGLACRRDAAFGDGPGPVPRVHVQPRERIPQRECQLPECHALDTLCSSLFHYFRWPILGVGFIYHEVAPIVLETHTTFWDFARSTSSLFTRM